MKVLKVEPGKEPAVIEISGDLESLQKEVEGPIEAIYPEDDIALICNEEGKITDLPLNRALKDETGEILDIIAGSFLITGLGEEDFCSLTDEQIRKYSEEFQKPEQYVWGRYGIMDLTDRVMEHPARYNRDEEAPLQACITNLGKYNEGELACEWISFPINEVELDLVLKEIGIDGKEYEEIFFSDYECDYPGLYAALSEFADIEDLNTLGLELSMMSPDERGKFAAVMEAEEPLSLEETISIARNLDAYHFLPKIQNDYELGYYWVEESGAYEPEGLGTLRNYIDYRSFGSDIRTDEGGSFCETGYVYRTGEPFHEIYQSGKGFVNRSWQEECR